jgi:four helix bundle protein
MATFKRFEDIKAWQKARKLTKEVYEVTAGNDMSRDYALRDQVRRAAISVMANIAEGCARRTDKEFANFLNIARASGAETQSHLYVALDLGYIDQATFSRLYELLDEVSRMTLSLAQHLYRQTRQSRQPR